MPNLEQVTCSEPTVTPINSAISSRLFPRSTRVLICWILAGVNVCREAKRLWLCAPITQSSLCPPRVPAPTMSIACSPLVCLLRCGPFNPNTHVSVKMVSSRTENVSILFRDAPMPNCLSKSLAVRTTTAWPMVNAAAKTWRRLMGENQFPKVVQGVKLQNGIEVIKMPAPPCRLIDLVTRSPA
jgi:hypothetical protein